jgi:hypothetical protein
MKKYHSLDNRLARNMSPIITDEFLDAVSHLRDVLQTRDPATVGYTRGQAVVPMDFVARFIVLNWLADTFEDSLMTRLLRTINPTAARRIFNDFLDGKWGLFETMIQCSMHTTVSGHEVTELEWGTMAQLLNEAVSLVHNSPITKFESLE